MVFIRPIAGKKLLGSAGRHTLVTDRKTEDGGTDMGFTSGELLLLAMASCATGSIRKALTQQAIPTDDIAVEVNLVPPKRATDRDGILITVFVDQSLLATSEASIIAAATSGGVVSRVKLGSEIEVCCRPLAESPPPPNS